MTSLIDDPLLISSVMLNANVLFFPDSKVVQNLWHHHMLAASFGEVAACLIRVPVEIIKQRRQTFSGVSPHIFYTFFSWKALSNPFDTHHIWQGAPFKKIHLYCILTKSSLSHKSICLNIALVLAK